MYSKLVMLSLGAWFFLSAFIDISVIPQVGSTGGMIYSSFNKLEVLLGTVLIFGLFKSDDLRWRGFQQFSAKIIFTIVGGFYWFETRNPSLLAKYYSKLDLVKIIFLLILVVLQFLPGKKKQGLFL
ncbi:hypothetical protein N9B72_01020 [Bacteriovoracaceae bacterium]|jgi:hypothetical protein|nr:hypothetical protein [Bacteriovoracaceae bacterium]